MEKGLSPLAEFILLQDKNADPLAEAEKYVNAEKGVENAEQALKGAADIIAEKVSDDAELRKTLRKKITETGELSCKLLEHENAKTYDMYAD